MDLTQTHKFRKDELKRAFSYICRNPEKALEITNPQDTLVTKRHLAETLHGLLENEFYQLALVMLYQCYYSMGLPEVADTWRDLIDTHISEHILLDFFSTVLCQIKDKESERLKEQ